MSAWKKTIGQCVWMFVATLAFAHFGLIDEDDKAAIMFGAVAISTLHATNTTPDRKDK